MMKDSGFSTKKGPFWIRACFYNPKSDVVHRYYETGSLEKAREILEAIKNGDLEFLENTRVFNKDK